MRNLYAGLFVSAGLVLSALLVNVPATSAADDTSISRFTPANVTEVLEAVGATGISSVKASDGTPVIRFVKGGRNYGVLFYACDTQGTNCAGMELLAKFTLGTTGATYPLEHVNSFNEKYPYGKAYVPAAGKLHSSRYVIADAGIPVRNLNSEFVNFFTITDNLQAHLRAANVISLAPGGATPTSYAPPKPGDHSSSHTATDALADALIPTNQLP